MFDGRADILIRGGTVVTDVDSRQASVAIVGDRIAAVVDDADAHAISAERTIDAAGLLVLPGGVDPHCHVGIKVGAYTTLDDYQSATLAALAGGTTTIVDFAIPAPGQDPRDALEERLALASDARCDYAEHGCIAGPVDSIDTTIGDLADAGVRTIKLFTTYRGILMVDSRTIEAVMRALKEVRGLTYVHAEHNELVEAAQSQAEAEGRIDAPGHAESRPEAAEERAVSDVLEIAGRADAPVYFVHQSTAGAIDLVRQARARGVAAFTESSPHYLTLDAGRYASDHPERYVCCPPLRDRASVDQLADRASRGLVHSVGSDNCCYDTRQKTEHAADVREMPNGLPGVETRLPVVFDGYVASGRMRPEQFVAMVATNPARLNGLYPRKGTIAAGSDADVVLFDPNARRVVDIADLHMPTDYSPYQGLELTGWPRMVISRGRVVLEDGELTDPGPVGQFLRADPVDAAYQPDQIAALA